MPESIPLRKKPPGPHKALAPAHAARPLDESDLAWSDRDIQPHANGHGRPSGALKEPESPRLSDEFDDWDEQDAAMPSDLRHSLERARADGHHAPLLGRKSDDEGVDGAGGLARSAHRFHERDPVTQAKLETRKKYTYAAIFLVLSLISFTVQTETAVYIQHELKWEKPYCMLYMTHGSWVVLWPTQLLLLRLQNRDQPWATFWRRHVQLLRQTALMVQHQTLHPTPRQALASPVRYMLRMTAFITCALTLAGGSWYVAVNQTTASDLTAIYNCSAFFAYAFSIPILHEKVRASKVAAVAIAVAGVFVVAYGDTSPAKHGSKSGGGTGGEKAPPSQEAQNRAFGNLVIGVGSVLYGLYEVLYKRLACPPEGASPNKGMIFANTFGSLIGAFTLCVLWIPLPLLHYTGWETFELPRGEQAWMMAISVLANASASNHFLFPQTPLSPLTTNPLLQRTPANTYSQRSPAPSSSSSPSPAPSSPPSPPSSPSSSSPSSTSCCPRRSTRPSPAPPWSAGC